MLGIAIINYNTFEKTIECIDSLFKTVKSEYRIYLLDNASPNNSYEELEKLYGNDERVVLIKSEENLGYARGNNLCLEKAKADDCDSVLISNNDIIFNENTVDALLKTLKEEKCFIVSPKIIGIDGRHQPSVKAVKPSFREYILFSNYIIGNLVSKKRAAEYYRKIYPSDKREVYWTSGACFMADTKQFEKIGYFDPYTFLYFEEFIVSEKALNNGLKILYCPDVSVIHYHGASTNSSNMLITRLANFKSECYVFSNYWVISKSKLRLIRLIRCLEVLYTFTKEKQFKNALSFIKESRKILKNTPRKKV